MWTSSSSSSSAISTTSLSSSTSSCPSPYSLRLPKTMEEVWRDITLASDLHHLPSPRGVILQDFFSKDPPPTSVPSPPPPPPLPPTMLTLSSVPDRFGRMLFHPHHQIPHAPSTADAVVPDATAKKRFPDVDRASGGDRRHKRMIKNRESAARSRARKQAYTNELELEVAHLLEENARLRKQQEQFCREEAAAEHHHKRKSLHRTFSAPF